MAQTRHERLTTSSQIRCDDKPEHNCRVRYIRQQGYTYTRVVIALVLIALLVYNLVPRIADIYRNAQRAQIQATSSAFRAAVLMVREQWYVQGKAGALQALTGFGNDDVAVSSKGWPTDALSTVDFPVDQYRRNTQADYLSAEICARIWRALLQQGATPVIPEHPNDVRGAEHTGSMHYQVSARAGSCRYEAIPNAFMNVSNRQNKGIAEIHYQATNGKITLTFR